MAETPKKITARTSCRLCGSLYESHRMCRILSKNENMCAKIKETCKVIVTEDDNLTKMICRNCKKFVNKISDFIEKCQNVQVGMQQLYSVKRCVELSPSVVPPSKKISISDNQETSRSIRSKRMLFASETETPSETRQPFIHERHVPMLSDDRIQKIIRAAESKQPVVLAHIIMEHCPVVMASLKKSIADKIDSSCKALCKRSGGSVLFGTTFESLKEFDFDLVWSEMATNVPFLVDIFKAVSGKNGPIESATQVKYGFTYSVLMNERWHELSRVKRVNTVLLIEGGCSKQLQERLNKLGVCLSHSRRDDLLKLLGGHFMDQVIEKVKNQRVFRGTGDNWDLKVLKGHMRKDIQNEDLHLFASNLIENRVNFSHLPNISPKNDILTLPRSKFSLNVMEWKKYAESAKVLIARILIDFFPQFNFLKSVTPKHIDHIYSSQMAEKSYIASLPIINANEAKYEDCVKILRTYEKWIAEIHVKAGLLEKMPHVNDTAIPEGPTAPGQPNAHRQDTQDDPMREMKIPFAGDQLTRVRFAGAKDLLAGSHTPSDRFEHCSPFKPVMFHTRASLLQYSYSLLHKAESVNQVGTLKYFREKYNRCNATPSKVIDSLEGSEELFVSIGRAYITTAAMLFFGMSTTDEAPTKNKFPGNASKATSAEKETYFNNVFEKFIDEFLFQKNTNSEADEDEDYVQNYAMCHIFLTILILQLKDTAAEADGDRNLINQKLLLMVFKSLGSYSKYALEMFISIAQMECLLTPRLAEEFKWGFFVNWKGGKGKNIEDDMAQEISNRLSKNIVQRMGPNKTISSISKVCRATNGIKQVIEQFDSTVGMHKVSTQHTTRDSMADEKEMVANLVELDPFNKVPGRSHTSFPKIKRCPLLYLNVVEYHQWIKKHMKELKR